MNWTMALAVYAAVASTLVVYLRISNARRKRAWDEGNRTLDAAIAAAVHHLPPAKPDRVVPDKNGNVGPRVIQYVDGDGTVRQFQMETGYIEVDWDGHRREVIRRLLTSARKSVHS